MPKVTEDFIVGPERLGDGRLASFLSPPRFRTHGRFGTTKQDYMHMSCCTCGYGRTLHANPDGPQENDQNVVPASSIPDPTELVCQPPKRPAAAAAASQPASPYSSCLLLTPTKSRIEVAARIRATSDDIFPATPLSLGQSELWRFDSSGVTALESRDRTGGIRCEGYTAPRSAGRREARR